MASHMPLMVFAGQRPRGAYEELVTWVGDKHLCGELRLLVSGTSGASEASGTSGLSPLREAR